MPPALPQLVPVIALASALASSRASPASLRLLNLALVGLGAPQVILEPRRIRPGVLPLR